MFNLKPFTFPLVASFHCGEVIITMTANSLLSVYSVTACQKIIKVVVRYGDSKEFKKNKEKKALNSGIDSEKVDIVVCPQQHRQHVCPLGVSVEDV